MGPARGWRGRSEDRSAEPHSVGAVLDGLLSERPLARGLPVGRLARSWEAVVGPRLAAETVPARLEGGTLVVAATTGPWGAQVRFLAQDILRRANEMLGSEVVRRVQVVVAGEGPTGSRKPL